MELSTNTYQLKIAPDTIRNGEIAKIRLIDYSEKSAGGTPKPYQLRIDGAIQEGEPSSEVQASGIMYTWQLNTRDLAPGGYFLDVILPAQPSSNKSSSKKAASAVSPPSVIASSSIQVMDASTENPLESIANTLQNFSLNPTERPRTPDLPLWISILNGTDALSFENYSTYMDLLFCNDEPGQYDNWLLQLRGRRFLPFSDTDAYRTLKVATEAFIMVHCGVKWENQDRLEDEQGIPIFQEDRVNQLLDLRGVNVDPNGPSYTSLWDGYLQTIDEGSQLTHKTIPYLYLIRRKLKDLPLKLNSIEGILDRLTQQSGTTDSSNSELDEANCFGLIARKLTRPCFIELIWSYWHEEAMLVQSMHAISRRFQNIRSFGSRDPLAGMEIDPLRPLNNLLWGYIQDEQHRLTIKRRALEYLHHYGFSLQGKAVPDLRPADTRAKFLEGFHHLLYLCAQYYKQEDNATIKADAFPIRNALREVHLTLSEGAHNQYGDLPSTARIEMMMQQWLLARPEFRQYIPRRNMVAFPEPWMDSVAGMNTLMGWNPTSPIHFSNLGIFGERLLLSIRLGSWSDTNIQSTQAAVWANFWRPAIQEYIHAYHAVTGVDLTARMVGERIDSRPPSYHIARQLKAQLNGHSGNGKARSVAKRGK